MLIRLDLVPIAEAAAGRMVTGEVVGSVVVGLVAGEDLKDTKLPCASCIAGRHKIKAGLFSQQAICSL